MYTFNRGFPLIFADTLIAPESTGQCDCDCDCACASYRNNDHALDVRDGDYLCRQQDSHSLPIDTDFTLLYSPYHPHVVLNKHAMGILDAFSSPHWKGDVGIGFPQMDDGGEVDAVVGKLVKLGVLVAYPAESNSDWGSGFSTRQLNVWLNVTDQCNLSCEYCYIGKNARHISPANADLALKNIFEIGQAYAYQKIKIKYAGGEALLVPRLVEGIHKQAQWLAKQTQLDLQGVVLSNGTTLTLKNLEILREVGLSLMVSLDGLAQTHDQQRHYLNGRGSASQVLANIELALQVGLSPEISITITHKSAAGLPDLVRWLLERQLKFSFNFYREHTVSANPENLRAGKDELASAILAAYRVIEENLPNYKLLSALADRANLAVPHRLPCGVGKDYLVVLQDGQVAPCQMTMNNRLGHIGNPKIMEIVRGQVLNVDVSEKMACASCQWSLWCAGGCPLTATMAGQAHSTYCDVYQMIFPALLRLEGLRLIQYGRLQ